MKYIKLFEHSDEPKIGDYVICTSTDFPAFGKFLEQNIGQIINIEVRTTQQNKYVFYRIEYNLKNTSKFANYFLKSQGKYYRASKLDNILYYSNNIEKLKIYIDTIRYKL